MVLGLITLTLMATSLLEAQNNLDSSKLRQGSESSDIVTDSAIARALVELSKPENSTFLTRNYDPIDPKTGKIYLGLDGVINSGDETTSAFDQWTGHDPTTFPCHQIEGTPTPNLNFLSGTIGDKGSYKILAYRYNKRAQEGTVLVEGIYLGVKAHMQVSISIRPILDNFPGIGIIRPHTSIPAGIIALRGREILGDKGNIYTIPDSSADPTLTGKSSPGAPNRDSYLNSIWSSSLDGVNADTVSGSIIACNLGIKIPRGITGTNFGVIDTSYTLAGKGGTVPTLYTLEGIELSESEVLTVDTTGGPVVIEMLNVPSQKFSLSGSSKILNKRTDGQPPKVGDVRIIIRHDLPVELHDQTCMSQVFLYSSQDELLLLTDGPGCPSGQNTNFEGVAWAEAIFGAKNDVNNRSINYLNGRGSYDDSHLITETTSGIAVPDDVSSLADLLQYVNLPIPYRYNEIKSWQKVTLYSEQNNHNSRPSSRNINQENDHTNESGYPEVGH